MNGLFPDQPDQPDPANAGYVLPRNEHHIEPVGSSDANPAVELIRRKIDTLYGIEPTAREELRETKDTPPRSKHQKFMHELSTSGRSLSEIQTAWHEYYVKLPDDKKREVWQEFYSANSRTPLPHTRLIQQRSAMSKPHLSVQLPKITAQPQSAPAVSVEIPRSQVVVSEHQKTYHSPDRRSVATIRKQVLKRVHASGNAQIKAKQHLQSLAFGLGLGALVILVFLFGFFNEMVIAPFIQPNNHAEATPIILTQNSVAPSSTPEVIVPKINVELPIIYGTSTNESDVENSLQDGVVHYASTSVPGQQGNAAFFGHSSNNIFNPGKYKFAFVLLHELVPGDIFYLTYNGKVYTYRVFQKQIVQPTDTWVLNPVQGKTATATLITCDPPGTSLHRLVVWGEQIDPSPDVNTNAPAPTQVATQPKVLASNGPTLWGRFWHWVAN
jgi:LPXTG-site transpeptidase (sortase) family protein